MAIRTTAGAVKLVLLQDYDSARTPDLTPFMRIASLLVDRAVTCASNKSLTLSTDEQRELETLLSAHAYCCSDQTFAEKQTSKSSGKFQGQTGKGLEGTKYGQLALTLDHTGCLRALSKGRTPGGYWLGLPPSEQTDYKDRD